MSDIWILFGAKVQAEILGLLDCLSKKAMSGSYIYRGEPEIYPRVCSSLYRQCEEKVVVPADLTGPNLAEWEKEMWELQKEIVAQARRFLPGNKNRDLYDRQFWGGSTSLEGHLDTREYEILCQIQHFGGATNLIDFSSDIFVALFFCLRKGIWEDWSGRLLVREATSCSEF